MNLLLRCRPNLVRAVLTDKYIPVNHSDLIPVIAKALENFNLKFNYFELSENGLWIKVQIPAFEQKFGNKTFRTGLLIGNSETGTRSVSCESYITTLSCSNQIVLQDAKYRHRHIGESAPNLLSNIESVVHSIIQDGLESLKSVKRSMDKKVEQPIKVIQKLCETQRYSDKFKERVLNSFSLEPGYSAFNVISSFTRASQGLNSETARIDVYRIAGRWTMEVDSNPVFN